MKNPHPPHWEQNGGPQPPVGYLVNHRHGASGRRGAGYNYILAGNGVFVQAENGLIRACIQAGSASVRGLAPIREYIELRNGPVPASLVREGIGWMTQTPDRERVFMVQWDGREYRLVLPPQDGDATRVSYAPTENAAAEFHSHGAGPAFFSETDDQDEQGLRIYGVVGRLRQPRPEREIRLGAYGHFSRTTELQAQLLKAFDKRK